MFHLSGKYQNAGWFLGITLITLALGIFFKPVIQNNYFDVTAQNFLSYGTLRLVEYPEYFSEVVPTENGQVIVAPPFPILTSAIGFFVGFNETILAQLAIGLSAGMMFFLLRHFRVRKWESFFLSMGYVLSTPLYFFLSHSGYWYTAQVWGVLGAELAWYFWLKKRYFLSGLGISLALLSRVNVGFLLAICLIFPVLFRSIFYQKSLKNAIHILLGSGVGVIALLLWNYYRFGSVLATGYDRIPGVLDEPWYQHGIMHWSYIWENFKMFLWQFDLAGLGVGMFWIQPYLLLLPFCLTRKNVQFLLWGILQFIFVLMHGNWGFWQFDFRFLMDALWVFFPILFVSAQGWKKFLAWIFLGASIALHIILLPQLHV